MLDLNGFFTSTEFVSTLATLIVTLLTTFFESLLGVSITTS